MLENVVLANAFRGDSAEIREVMTKYAASIFDDKHLSSKFVLLLALSDSNGEVRKIASDSLQKLAKEKRLPYFTELMSYVKIKSKMLKDVKITAEMLLYIHACLENEIQVSDGHTFFEGLTRFIEQSVKNRPENPANYDAFVIYINWLQSLTFESNAGSMRSRYTSLNNVANYLLVSGQFVFSIFIFNEQSFYRKCTAQHRTMS